MGFRLLEDVSISFEDDTTVIVGRNNTGKTSLTEIFSRFLNMNRPKFRLEDFSLNTITKFREVYDKWKNKEDNTNLATTLPLIKLEVIFDYEDEKIDYGNLSDFIIDFDETIFQIRISFEYRLIDGQLDKFLNAIGNSERKDFFDKVRDQLNIFFDTYVYAVDPTDENNKSIRDIGKIKNILAVDLIHAQRGLDDETSHEKDLLGKVLTNIFKVGNTENAPDDMKKKNQDLEEVVVELQEKIDGDFRERVNALLPALKIFGYPGLSDPNLTTETILNIENFLESNTRVLYKKENGISLPETYNGLGSRNLIYILFQVYDFFRKYQSTIGAIKMQLIFIEEPEVHLHPQMQEVFIKKLKEIAKTFSESINGNKRWNVQFVVSSHSSHIANEAQFSSIRYFISRDKKEPKTVIKDIGSEFNSEDNKDDSDFIHKYLTLTKCDLFFADKAILIEGPTERILIPEILKKIDKKYSSNLSTQYISSIEIGGAYAHHFYKFLDFLEIKTLIISDLDSTCLNKDSGRYCACIVSKGTHTSNSGLKRWFVPEKDSIQEILNCKESDKVKGYKRIAFQIPEDGSKIIGRSFEESFILANREIFGFNTSDDSTIELVVSEKANQIDNEGKANFAIEYAIEKQAWKVPLYIDEGLRWLAE